MADSGRDCGQSSAVSSECTKELALGRIAQALCRRVRRGVPYLGMVTILLNDYPHFKYVLLGVMGLYVLTSRDE